VAGMSLGEADLLRRAMGGKRQCESITLHQHRFMAGALAGGMGEEAAFSLWRQISSFAGYAFCKAHSASFARLSFQMAWLRAHHPALFFAMILRHNGGYYHPQTYVDEARRLGIRLLPPCVVHGSWLTEAVDEQTIRLGLQWVRGLNQQAALEMLGRRPFAHWHAFLARVTLDRESLAMLVLAGATDNLITSSDPLSRQERLWMVESRTRPVAHTLPHLEDGTATWTPEAEESLEERLQRELHALGLALSDHPLRLFRAHLTAAVGRVISARRLASLQEGMAASCVGLPVAYKSMETKKGEPMCFLTLSDRTGLIETTLFPDMVKRLGAGVRHRGPWWVRGIVEKGSLVVKEATLIAAG
ncbi:MAG: hypothetical protein HQL55_18600, partial [Magnetococcales bacterium]|nr:hypothetical protein [Magnetococcales bacterium]